MQIKNKFIEPASGSTTTGVTDNNVRLRSANYLRSRNAANSADVNLLRSNASDVIEFPSVPQIASGTPSADADVATIASVKLIAKGLTQVKDSVRALSTTNVSLPPGGTTLTIDSVSLANNDRVALTGQSTASQNGIYVVSGIGTSVVLTRSSDANVTGDIVEGTSFLVDEGTANAQSTWMVTTTGAITIGSTSITISKISAGASYTASPTGGLSLVGGAFSANIDSASTKINGSNQIVSLKPVRDSFTLTGTDITNQYIDLSQTANANASIVLTVVGGPEQTQGTDYTINLTGGSGSHTRLTFAGDLATAGAAALVSGDIVYVRYMYL